MFWFVKVVVHKKKTGGNPLVKARVEKEGGGASEGAGGEGGGGGGVLECSLL